MSRIAYVNGRYLPMRNAAVHVEDRGYQFGDGVYDVCEVRGGRLIDERRHLDRLKRSLAELRIRLPMSPAALGIVLREVIAKNRIGYGIVYLQVTRGVARRDHAFPAPEVLPSVVVTARALNSARNEALAATGIAVVSVPDNRWGRVDIKTIGLLPNVLARQAAIERGARDAWFVDKDGNVTEAASANAWIVTAAGTIVTRPAGRAILRGITRTVVLEAIKAQGLAVEERAFTLEEVYAAREAFVTAASQIVLPVVRIDGRLIGDGKPGPVATALRREFHRYAETGCA
jgi:D-alanine transaminase